MEGLFEKGEMVALTETDDRAKVEEEEEEEVAASEETEVEEE